MRHRATYKRPHGVRYYFGAYDVQANRLWMRPKKRKRWQEVVDWCEASNIALVFTATYASWMNRIECHFTAVKRFVISNSDYPDHAAIAKAMQDYLRWRNRNTDDKELRKTENSRRVL